MGALVTFYEIGLNSQKDHQPNPSHTAPARMDLIYQTTRVCNQ